MTIDIGQRIEAAASAICRQRTKGPTRGEDFDTELARAALNAADRVDPLRIPHADLHGRVPLVLFFETEQDAKEFAEAVTGAFRNPVQIDL